MSALLVLLFFVTAALYASVGFGGGSTYNALLALSGTDYRVLPLIALACNVVVVSGGVWRFARIGETPLRPLAPFLATSIPAAWIGGRLPIPETAFVFLLGAALLVAGVQLLLQSERSVAISTRARTPLAVSLGAGAGIGFLAGLVGIGGGIFLAPVLYFLNFGSPRVIAAACSLFILLNSLSGAFGQLAKLSDIGLLSLATPYWPLIPTVLVGGQIGSWLSTSGLRPIWVKRLTAALILYVAVRLLVRFAAMVLV
ncbi:MAG: sulfite exporter TauE/SafE family protein [Pseudomonadota bacterium]